MLFPDAEGNWSINAVHIDEKDTVRYFSSYFYKSLEINGKVYFDVVELKDGFTNYWFKQLFYNKTYGILQINRDDKNSLTINH